MRQADILEKVRPFCDQFGVKMNRSDISQYISGKVVPSQRKLSILSMALGVQEPWLIGYDVPMKANDDSALPSNIRPVEKVKVPLIGSIAAGLPIFAEEDLDTYIEADSDIRCDFALIVEGDSMEPTIHNGDVVFIRKQDDVDDGQIAAIIIDDSATLKHVYHIPGGIQLISENPKYPPQIYTMENSDYVAVLGRAVAYKRIL